MHISKSLAGIEPRSSVAETYAMTKKSQNSVNPLPRHKMCLKSADVEIGTTGHLVAVVFVLNVAAAPDNALVTANCK
jgi:hypothetical protein